MHIKRLLTDYLPNPAEKKLVILTGARQTGKTTLAQQKFQELRYINLDAPENREAVRAVHSDLWSQNIGNAVIDEAQKEPIIFEKIKYAFDAQRISFSVLLGSSQILLLKKIRESLAGRVSIFELWPLLICELSGNNAPLVKKLLTSPRDFAGLLSKESEVRFDQHAAVKKQAHDHVAQWGGMPALISIQSPEERWRWLKDYEYTYLERDLGDLARLDDLEPFRKFQKLAALRSACLLNYSELARDAGVSNDTARRYLEYLRLSYQVILLQPYTRNITSSTVKMPKLFWLDIGLLRQLSSIRSALSGQTFESMVVSEFYKMIKTTQAPVEPYYYRTRAGLEVDLLLKTEQGIIGIEIKNREKIQPVDTRPLRDIAAKLNTDWLGGIVVYRGPTVELAAEPNIWAVPSDRLFA